MAIIVNPDLLKMTLDEWKAYCDRLDREGVLAPVNAEHDAKLVAMFEAIAKDPASRAAAQAAAAYIRARRPAAGQPALVTPGMVSEEAWLKAASKHGAFLERLRLEFEDSEGEQ